MLECNWCCNHCTAKSSWFSNMRFFRRIWCPQKRTPMAIQGQWQWLLFPAILSWNFKLCRECQVPDAFGRILDHTIFKIFSESEIWQNCSNSSLTHCQDWHLDPKRIYMSGEAEPRRPLSLFSFWLRLFHWWLPTQRVFAASGVSTSILVYFKYTHQTQMCAMAVTLSLLPPIWHISDIPPENVCTGRNPAVAPALPVPPNSKAGLCRGKTFTIRIGH